MSVFSIDDITPDQSSRAGLAPNGYRLARLETDRGDRLKLVEPIGMKTDPQSSKKYVLDQNGFAYLSYIVPNIREIISRLQKVGAKIRTGGDPVMFRAGVFIIFAEDPDGNVLEFIERNDLDRYRPARGSH
jgi:catechol 2,3-dioxygenase-like lactoylglutathione lyase family enzyme